MLRACSCSLSGGEKAGAQGIARGPFWEPVRERCCRQMRCLPGTLLTLASRLYVIDHSQHILLRKGLQDDNGTTMSA